MFATPANPMPSWIPNHDAYDSDPSRRQADIDADLCMQNAIPARHSFPHPPPPPPDTSNFTSVPTSWGQTGQHLPYPPQNPISQQGVNFLPSAPQLTILDYDEGLSPGQNAESIYTMHMPMFPYQSTSVQKGQVAYSPSTVNSRLPFVHTVGHEGNVQFNELGAIEASPDVSPADNATGMEYGPATHFTEAVHTQYHQHLEGQYPTQPSLDTGNFQSSEEALLLAYEQDSPLSSVATSMLDADTYTAERESFLALLESQDPLDSVSLPPQSSIDTTFATSNVDMQGDLEAPSGLQQSAQHCDLPPETGLVGEPTHASGIFVEDVPYYRSPTEEASYCPDLQNGESETPIKLVFDQASTANDSTSPELSAESLEERTPRREQKPHQSSQLTIHPFLHWLARESKFTPKKIFGDDYVLEEALVGCGGPNDTWITVQARFRPAGQPPAAPPLQTPPQPEIEVTEPPARRQRRKGAGKRAAQRQSKSLRQQRKHKQLYRLRHVPVDPSIPKPKDCYRHCTGKRTILPWLDVEDVGRDAQHIDEEDDEDEMEL